MTTSRAWLLLLGACTNAPLGGGEPDPLPEVPEVPEHADRFVGLWAVTQPYHALYEQTHYWFRADGRLDVGASIPDDCTGHLGRHCVTGSVANCVPESPAQGSCTSDLTCVFGSQWYSLDASTLVIIGDCSDGLARPIRFAFNPDSSGNAGFGANATLISVAGDSNWSHDNWEWAFQKCTDGNEETCPFGSPLP